MLTSFPKIFSLGTPYIRDIFAEPVSVSEKIDGSQICFGVVQGHLHMRSKGATLYRDAPVKMFVEGIAQICGRYDREQLPEGLVFHGEYLRAPKHNTLTYKSIPLNHIALFSVSSPAGEYYPYDVVVEWAERLKFGAVPEFYHGMVSSMDQLMAFLDRESCLGGPKIEGVVCKNYARAFLLGGQPIPLMSGKLVSEAFKEVHKVAWKGQTVAGRWETFKESYRTEARWQKAVQHLAERGELAHEPRDIGKLIKEVQRDITEEEKATILQMMWSEFSPDFLRNSIRGLPEWYKEQLAATSFHNQEVPPDDQV